MNTIDQTERPMRRSVLRGWRRRCPCCGAGDLMSGFLKVTDTCTVCGEELHHHRADDGPTWATIMIVGHVIVPAMLSVYMRWQPDPMLMATGFCIAAVAMSLYLLPRLKGAFVAIQWANRMHGFGAGPARA